jgi:hypothetical protein
MPVDLGSFTGVILCTSSSWLECGGTPIQECGGTPIQESPPFIASRYSWFPELTERALSRTLCREGKLVATDGLMEGTVEEEEMEDMNKNVHNSCTRSFGIALFGAPALVGSFI